MAQTEARKAKRRRERRGPQYRSERPRESGIWQWVREQVELQRADDKKRRRRAERAIRAMHETIAVRSVVADRSKYAHLDLVLSRTRPALDALPPSKRRGSPKSIYVLVDPRDETVRYVGITGNTRVRLTWHIDAPSNRGVAEWVAGLMGLGHLPKIVTVRRRNWADWGQAERLAISIARQLGRVYNVHPGGPL